MGTENTQAPALDYAAIAKGAQDAEKAPAAVAPATKQPDGSDDEGDAQEVVKPPEKPVEPKVEEKKPEAQKSELEVNFEKLVRQGQENRKLMEAAKPGIELANTLGLPNAQALQRAIVSKNPLDALAAIGFSYKDVANAVIGQGEQAKGRPAQPNQTPKPPEQQQVQLPSEVQEMLREHKQLKAERQQQQVETKIREVITSSDKFKLISGLDATQEVVSVLEEMFARGGFPSSDPTENIRIAAEEAEKRLTRQKERWSKVLTASSEPATVQTSKAPETPATAQGSGERTLTNSLAAPAAGAPPTQVFDIEDIYSKLKNDPNMRK